MEARTQPIRAIAMLLALLACGLSLGAAVSRAPALGDGLSYQHLQDDSKPWSIHVLTVDLRQPDLQFVTTLAQNTIFGLSRVTQQLALAPKRLGRPVAAVNGDFFVIQESPYQGDPQGLQIVDGEFVSAPDGAACFWIATNGQPAMDVIAPRLQVTWPDGTKFGMGLNEEIHADSAVLFTPRLGKSTRTPKTPELILEPAGAGPWLPLRASTVYRARIRALRTTGDTKLAPGLMVLALERGRFSRLAPVKPGDTLLLSTHLSRDFSGVQTAIGGGPTLITNGVSRQWPPTQLRHPRTAIGWNDTNLFLVVVDGRQPKLSIGMTFPELTDLMARLGCTSALNLDGGGSSVLWADGKIWNSPSDKIERSVANALILLRKPTPLKRAPATAR